MEVASALKMPGMSGLQVLELVKASKPDLPVLILSGLSSIPTAVEAAKLGAAEYLIKPLDDENLGKAVRSHIKVDDMFKTIVDDPVTYRDLFKLFRRDTTIFNHCANVCLLAISFGVYLELKPNLVKIFGLGTLFHDVGMNRVKPRILNKEGPLTRSEWEEVKKHPERGYSLMKSAVVVPVPSLRIILEHHERPDGSGYPRGLKGDAISQLARLCQIVDKFDSMTTRKPYREPLTSSDTLKRIYYEESTEKFKRIIIRFIEFLGGK